MGVNKCGTSAASFFLSNHPEVQKAKGETNFFNDDRNYEKGYSWYSQQFPEPQEGIKMYEKTPSYYKSSEAPKRVKIGNKDIKLINVGKIFINPWRKNMYFLTSNISSYFKFVITYTERFHDSSIFKNTPLKNWVNLARLWKISTKNWRRLERTSVIFWMTSNVMKALEQWKVFYFTDLSHHFFI